MPPSLQIVSLSVSELQLTDHIKLYNNFLPTYPRCRFPWFQLPALNQSLKEDDPPSDCSQKVSSGLTYITASALLPSVCLIPRHLIISRPHGKQGDGNITRRFESERDHGHVTFITEYCLQLFY